MDNIKLELNISPNLTVEDIHKIREYNHEMTKNMTLDERNEYIRQGAGKTLNDLAKRKREKELALN